MRRITPISGIRPNSRGRRSAGDEPNTEREYRSAWRQATRQPPANFEHHKSLEDLGFNDLGLRGLIGDEPIDLYDILEPRRRGVATAVQRQAAGRRCHGSAASPRPGHRDHGALVPQPAHAGVAEEGGLIECPRSQRGVMLMSTQLSLDLGSHTSAWALGYRRAAR
jgi:hypothetical protein